jgi:hypothetical protein
MLADQKAVKMVMQLVDYWVGLLGVQRVALLAAKMAEKMVVWLVAQLVVLKVALMAVRMDSCWVGHWVVLSADHLVVCLVQKKVG